MQDDFAETGKLRSQLLPQPGTHVFDGGVFQTFDLVEIGMIELLHERLHRFGNLCVIVNPADVWIGLAFDGDLQLEGVAVHLGAFVFAGEIGQRLSGLETKVFDDACAHGGISLRLSVCRGGDGMSGGEREVQAVHFAIEWSAVGIFGVL